MLYLKINSNQTIQYPYSISQLYLDNPNTSFSEQIEESTLSSYNIYKVITISKGNDHTKNYTETLPELIDGKYYQKWVTSDATQEEIQQRINNKWNEVRMIRNQYLSECDWTQLEDAPFNTSKKNEWKTYRQALRDITNQQDPFNIIWPTKPI